MGKDPTDRVEKSSKDGGGWNGGYALKWKGVWPI